MEYRKFAQGYVLRLDPGEEIAGSLTRLVEEEGVQLAEEYPDHITVLEV